MVPGPTSKTRVKSRTWVSAARVQHSYQLYCTDSNWLSFKLGLTSLSEHYLLLQPLHNWTPEKPISGLCSSSNCTAPGKQPASSSRQLLSCRAGGYTFIPIGWKQGQTDSLSPTWKRTSLCIRVKMAPHFSGVSAALSHIM